MLRGFCFRHFRTADAASSIPGKLVNLQVITKALPEDRNRVPAWSDIITVIMHDISTGKTCVPFFTDASPVKRRLVTVHHDIPSAVQHPVPDQRKRPDEQPESITAVMNSPCEAGRSILIEWDDVSGCRTAMLLDRDTGSAQRNSMLVHQNNPPVQRDSIPFTSNSFQAQLPAVSNSLFSIKTAIFHQFRHFRRSLSTNHTHGDAHVTTLFLYSLTRRHNACFSFTQQ